MIIAAKNLDKRIPQKQQLILAQLRGDIVQGRIALGSKLPTHIELAQRFAVSNVTIQRALDRLVHEGFVATQGRRGTFVTQRPPHLSRYALVFPSSPETDNRWGWSRFWNLCVQEATRAKSDSNREVVVYQGINEQGNSADYFRLVDDVASHRIAGIIFMAPFSTGRAVLPGSEKLPRLGVGSRGHLGEIDVIHFEDMKPAAFKSLADRGAKRIAVISTDHPNSHTTQQWLNIIQSHGLESRTQWIQGVNAEYAPWARNLAQLLMTTGTERPDGLYITDDNLVEYVTAGLLDAGVRVPDELEVVAHCNYPWVTPSVIPAQRLGYNIRTLISSSLDVIDARRRGMTPPDITIRASFDHMHQLAGNRI